tara:strand:- start:3078 stop:3680 length:603 start_codon:yes stop_codon:yes gene_type:complete
MPPFKFDLRGLLEDENFLIGAGLLTAGAKGQSIGEAAFPTIMNAAKTQKMFQDTAKSTKSVYDVELKKNVLKTDLEIKNNPQKYEPAKNVKTESNSLSKEALLLYKESQNIPKDKFKGWFDSLSTSQQSLYNTEIRGKISNIEQFMKIIEDQEAKTQSTALPVPMNGNQIDVKALQEGIVYNLNGQIVRWNGKNFEGLNE